jgi:hypothetical protein
MQQEAGQQGSVRPIKARAGVLLRGGFFVGRLGVRSFEDGCPPAEKPEVRSGPGLPVASSPSGPVSLNIVKPTGSD